MLILAVLPALLVLGCAAAGPSPDPGATSRSTLMAEASLEGTPAPMPSHSPTPTSSEPSPAPSTNTPSSAAQSPPPSPPASATPAPAVPVFEQTWATAPLTDVVTGSQFSLSSLAAEGKVVFVETMAIWCTNCRAQQREAVLAFAELDPSRVVWVGLDVETSETADALARYRDENGFPFTYAIADRSISRALAEDFGDVVLSPPSVNLIILGGDGRISHLTGHHTASELSALAAANGA